LKGNFHSISSIKDEQPIENHAISLEPIDNVLQQSFQVFHDPISDVLDDVCSQSPSPLANYEIETSIDTNFIPQSLSLSFSTGASSQSLDESLHSLYEEEKSNPSDELSHSAHEFKDPYAVLLEMDRASILFNLGKFGSVYKFSWEFPFSSSLLLFISKHLWKMKTAARMLTWLH